MKNPVVEKSCNDCATLIHKNINISPFQLYLLASVKPDLFLECIKAKLAGSFPRNDELEVSDAGAWKFLTTNILNSLMMFFRIKNAMPLYNIIYMEVLLHEKNLGRIFEITMDQLVKEQPNFKNLTTIILVNENKDDNKSDSNTKKKFNIDNSDSFD